MKTPRSEYDRDYKKMHYDQIAFRVKKGKREEYQQAANDFGLGLSEMIRLAVETYIADRSLHDLPHRIYHFVKPFDRKIFKLINRAITPFISFSFARGQNFFIGCGLVPFVL